MNAKHTNGPWEIEGEGQELTAIYAPDGHAVAFLKGRVSSVQDANAAFIVRACNAHDDLVAALEGILLWDDGNLPGDALDTARTALAKAKGGA